MNPLILLHGALGDETQLLPLRNKLSSARRVISFNFSGHGGKPFSNHGFGIESFAQELIDFMHDRSIASADIFGYSMGGYIALVAAFNNPACFGKIISLGTKFDWTPTSSEKEIQKLIPEKIEQKAPAFAAQLQQRHLPQDWRILVKETIAMILSLGNNPILSKDVLSKIPHPVLICSGEEDTMALASRAESIALQLPHGSFQLLRNTPHQLEKVDLDILHKIIVKFLY